MKKVEGANEAWKVTAQCKAGLFRDEIPCGEKYEIGEDDLVVQTVVVNCDLEMEIIGFKCPKCGSYTELNFNVVPEVIRKSVLAKYYREKKPVGGVKAGGRGLMDKVKRVFG